MNKIWKEEEKEAGKKKTAFIKYFRTPILV